jgi:branched-chain amino acid transport system substrate-binding protein
MNKIKQTNPDAIYFGGIIENNADQLVKDKVGAGMSNEEVAFIVPAGVYVDTYLSQGGDAAEAPGSPSVDCRRASSPPRGRSS